MPVGTTRLATGSGEETGSVGAWGGVGTGDRGLWGLRAPSCLFPCCAPTGSLPQPALQLVRTTPDHAPSSLSLTPCLHHAPPLPLWSQPRDRAQILRLRYFTPREVANLHSLPQKVGAEAH